VPIVTGWSTQSSFSTPLPTSSESRSINSACPFRDYNNTDDEFHYTIAIVWTASDIRDVTLSTRSRSSASTQLAGNPLPQGERLASRHARRDFLNAAPWPARLPEVRVPL